MVLSEGGAIGLLLVPCFIYGAEFVLLKYFDSGDGIYVQLHVGIGLFYVGLIAQLILNSTFYPVVLIGGMCFYFGNLLVTYAIRCNGIALSILIWTTAQMILGWAQSRFGWFGTKSNKPNSDPLCYAGLACCAVGGILSALGGGTCFAFFLTPVAYATEHYNDAPEDGASILFNIAVHYLFGLCTGSFMTSIAMFGVYSAAKNRRPYVGGDKGSILVLNSIIFGVLWAIATVMVLICTQVLSQAIAIPMISRLPSVVGALFGVLYYKEIKGTKNYIFTVIGVCLTLIGSGLIAASKIVTI